MASIEIILRDDEGKIINQRIRNRYELSLDGERLSEIETAVETFKRASLPEITHDLLAAAQQRQTEAIKKKSR